jgi:hypothetical protein
MAANFDSSIPKSCSFEIKDIRGKENSNKMSEADRQEVQHNA